MLRFAVEFPVRIFGIHPHQLFDVLSLLVGTQLFWWGLRRKGSPYDADAKLTLAAGCILGGVLGAKLIVLFEDPALVASRVPELSFWLTGKSIVGGLLGGLLGVEIAKRFGGITRRTGDHFVVPLAVGLAVGRVGCFLSGLTDDTFGTPTRLPWGIDFGDGIGRHPTQLYEIAFCVTFLALIPLMRSRPRAEGDLFRAFMISYFAFRFAEEFIRVSPRAYGGLTIYQLGCAAGLAYYAVDARQRAKRAAMPANTATMMATANTATEPKKT